MALFRGTGGGSEAVFSIYDDFDTIHLKARGISDTGPYTFLRTNGEYTYPEGTWNFDGANVTNLNVTAKFA